MKYIIIFIQKNGGYKAFSNLLERDGYIVESYKGAFKKKGLSKGKILVISNALNEKNVKNWFLPCPSAFTKKEIEIVKKWVYNGGSLFLIVDYIPMAGAAKDLAKEFGFEFTNGFAFDTLVKGPAFFSLKENTLIESTITKGRNQEEKVSRIASFTGQAFKIPTDAKSILVLNENFINFLPDTAWVFDGNTRKYSAKGWSQGAHKNYSKGKVVAFGEAAMFTALLAGSQKIRVGMNNDAAPDNYKLLLNIIHWLDGIIK